ncbi:MAG: DNA gyrase/topoisomerase IV subunit A, partial [Alistipes sp.]|nr:DNA gyrase/topoisomerase IV subunit A [Alistipes sp.]
ALCSKNGAKLQITYKGNNATRPADEIVVDEFVGVKSRKAKGKRLSTYDVDTLTFIEPEEEEIVEDETLPTDEAVEGDEPMDGEQEEQTTILMTEDEEYQTEQLNLF